MIERIGAKSIFTYIGLEKAMAKYKPYDYSQRVMVPVSLEEQLVPGTLEFAIQTLVETRIDMSIFDHRYRNDEGAVGVRSEDSFEGRPVGLLSGVDLFAADRASL